MEAELPAIPGTQSGIVKQQNSKPVASRKRKVKEPEPVKIDVPVEQMTNTGDRFIDTIIAVEETRETRAINAMTNRRGQTLKKLADHNDLLTDELINGLLDGGLIDYE